VKTAVLLTGIAIGLGARLAWQVESATSTTAPQPSWRTQTIALKVTLRA
jgi:hypothetical protein